MELITSVLTIISYLPLFAFVAAPLGSGGIVGVTVVFVVFQLLGTIHFHFVAAVLEFISSFLSNHVLRWFLLLLVDAVV